MILNSLCRKCFGLAHIDIDRDSKCDERSLLRIFPSVALDQPIEMRAVGVREPMVKNDRSTHVITVSGSSGLVAASRIGRLDGERNLLRRPGPPDTTRT